MRVHVMGPNLIGSGTPETFHVHGEGCLDVQRSDLYQGRDHKDDRESTVEVDSLLDVAEYVYDFEENPEDALGDFKVYPCAGGLPLGV